MEWQKFLHSNSQESTFGQFNAPHINHEVVEKTGQWTLEEKQVFDNALSKLNPASPSFFDYVASILPHKSLEEIKNHYLNLFLIPENNVVAAADDDYDPDHQHYQLPQADDSDMVGRPVSSPQVEYNRPRRRKGIPWTEEEHQLFLMGLNTFGKGDWKNISRVYVVSKTPTQVASHAQKYFNRQNSTTPLGRRRPSINDIQTVTLAPASTTTHQINGTLAQGASSMPSLHYPYNVAPMSSGHGNFGRFFSGAEASSSSSNNMVQQTINCNNINIHLKPVSPRPFF